MGRAKEAAMLIPIATGTTDWRNRAECTRSHVDPSWFYMTVDSGSETVKEPTSVRNARHGKAVEICSVCPVVAECLAYALEDGSQSGVLGGKRWTTGKPGDHERCNEIPGARRTA